MITWQQVIDRGLGDRTPEELATLLPALTQSALKVEAVKAWLLNEGLWKETGKTTMGGTLATAAASDAAVAGVLEAFYPAVFGGATGDGTLHTNSPDHAPDYANGLALLKSKGLLTDTQIDAFYNLDGGRLWKDVTLAQIQAAKSDYDAGQLIETAVQGIRDRCVAATEAAEAEARTASATASSVTSAGEGAFNG